MDQAVYRRQLDRQQNPPHPANMIITTIIIFFTSIFALWVSRPRRRLTSVDEASELAVASHDNDDDFELAEEVALAGVLDIDVQPRKILPRLGTPNYWRFAAKVAHAVKCKMGLPKQSEANRLVALELVSKELLARSVRKCDVHRFQSVAVDLVFMPTRYDVMASQMRSSYAYKERLLEMQVGATRTWCEWLGRLLPFRRWEQEVQAAPGLQYSRG